MIGFRTRETINMCMKRNILIVGLMGFFAGLPLLMCGPILAFWLSQCNIELSTVSVASLASLPYALKFLWSPFIEKTSIPGLSKVFSNQKSWLVVTQTIIGLTMIILGQIDPSQKLIWVIALIFITSIAAATQESIMLTYDLSRLNSLEYSLGEAMRTSGYRLGMLCSSITSLYISNYHSWGLAYSCIGIILLCAAVFSWKIEDSFNNDKINTKIAKNFRNKKKIPNNYTDIRTKSSIRNWLFQTFIGPWREIKFKEGWLAAVILMFIYKAGDNLVGNLHNVFYTSLGFSKIEIAEISKIFGTFATITGCITGAMIINSVGLGKTLIYGCISHAIATSLYIIMCQIGYHKPALYGLIFFEHFTGGLRTTALFTLRMYICEGNLYAFSQMAILSSLTTMGRSIFSTFSGSIVENFGWEAMFLTATILSVPGFIIILYISQIKRYSFLDPKLHNKSSSEISSWRS